MATGDDDPMKGAAHPYREPGEQRASSQEERDAFLTPRHVDSLRETMRMLNWGVRSLERTLRVFNEKGVPAITRLADELELARRGTLEPENPEKPAPTPSPAPDE